MEKLWRCKECGYISVWSKFVAKGFCERCRKYYVMKQYDPINDPEEPFSWERTNEDKEDSNKER